MKSFFSLKVQQHSVNRSIIPFRVMFIYLFISRDRRVDVVVW